MRGLRLEGSTAPRPAPLNQPAPSRSPGDSLAEAPYQRWVTEKVVGIVR
jgi:hypothetical protein